MTNPRIDQKLMGLLKEYEEALGNCKDLYHEISARIGNVQV